MQSVQPFNIIIDTNDEKGFELESIEAWAKVASDFPENVTFVSVDDQSANDIVRKGGIKEDSQFAIYVKYYPGANTLTQVEDKKDYCQQLIDIAKYMFLNRIIHGDFNDHNILALPNGTAVIIDWETAGWRQDNVIGVCEQIVEIYELYKMCSPHLSESQNNILQDAREAVEKDEQRQCLAFLQSNDWKQQYIIDAGFVLEYNEWTHRDGYWYNLWSGESSIQPPDIIKFVNNLLVQLTRGDAQPLEYLYNRI